MSAKLAEVCELVGRVVGKTLNPAGTFDITKGGKNIFNRDKENSSVVVVAIWQFCSVRPATDQGLQYRLHYLDGARESTKPMAIIAVTMAKPTAVKILALLAGVSFLSTR